MDAVRVMTIHGSKGWNFAPFIFRRLRRGYMPSSGAASAFLPPPSLLVSSMQTDGS